MDYPLLPIEYDVTSTAATAPDLPLPDVWNNARKTRSNPTLEALCIDFALCYNTINIAKGGILVFPKPQKKLPFNCVETCSIIPTKSDTLGDNCDRRRENVSEICRSHRVT